MHSRVISIFRNLWSHLARRARRLTIAPRTVLGSRAWVRSLICVRSFSPANRMSRWTTTTTTRNAFSLRMRVQREVFSRVCRKIHLHGKTGDEILFTWRRARARDRCISCLGEMKKKKKKKKKKNKKYYNLLLPRTTTTCKRTKILESFSPS